ncbi:MAG: DUF2268 domain-containing protein [Patescibacteria group bacterium]|nr:DUF2268 domain-containing protein [Patescibacteria group bacterium]MCL5095653.1 DUF2268 domain-containing protein [Patescibacteria group bacterium]
MNIKPQILHASGRLKPFEHAIKKVSKSSIDSIVKLIPIDNVDIIFYDGGTKGIIQHLGVGGYSATVNLIMISINPEFNKLEESLKENLPRIIAHELYHCIRKYRYRKKQTLFGALINEGLADHFDIEVNKKRPEKWDVALDKKQLRDLSKRAKGQYNDLSYNHEAWFFGSKKEKIPRWAGYTVGFNLIAQYLKRHPNKKPSNLYNQDVEFFL